MPNARKAAKRLLTEGRQVDIIAPPNGHKDFNDLLIFNKEKAEQKPRQNKDE